MIHQTKNWFTEQERSKSSPCPVDSLIQILILSMREEQIFNLTKMIHWLKH